MFITVKIIQDLLNAKGICTILLSLLDDKRLSYNENPQEKKDNMNENYRIPKNASLKKDPI